MEDNFSDAHNRAATVSEFLKEIAKAHRDPSHPLHDRAIRMMTGERNKNPTARSFIRKTRLANGDKLMRARAYAEHGAKYGRAEMLEEAIRYFDKALEIDPEDSEVFLNKSTALRVLKREDEARKTYEEAMRLSPRNKLYEFVWSLGRE